MSWFDKLIPSRVRTDGQGKGNVPEGLWLKCASCQDVLYRAELERNQDVCPKCGVVGERFARGAEAALADNAPLICFCASGGARMQESLFSLFQMAKTSSLLAQLADKGVPYISVLTDPTTGGVSASFAMLGDLNVAEPGAQIGFAGRRVIEQTVRETLPEGFQRSEFLLSHGAIDMIVDRREMRDRLASILRMLCKRPALATPEAEDADATPENA